MSRRQNEASYCRSCDGYTAEVGKLDDDGWCERCTYRNALDAIRSYDAFQGRPIAPHENPTTEAMRRIAAETLERFAT